MASEKESIAEGTANSHATHQEPSLRSRACSVSMARKNGQRLPRSQSSCHSSWRAAQLQKSETAFTTSHQQKPSNTKHSCCSSGRKDLDHLPCQSSIRPASVLSDKMQRTTLAGLIGPSKLFGPRACSQWCTGSLETMKVSAHPASLSNK